MEMISNIYSANCAGIMSQTGNKQRNKKKEKQERQRWRNR